MVHFSPDFSKEHAILHSLPRRLTVRDLDVRYVSDASRAALSYFRSRTSSSTHHRFEALASSLPDELACSCPVFTSTSTLFRCSLCSIS